MTQVAAPRSALSMVTRGHFSRFWWASVVSSTGDWIAVFATIALGNAIAGEAGVLLALMSRVLPGLLFGAFVGVITDRVDRRFLIVISDLGRAFLVPLLVFATTLPVLVGINLALEMLSLLGQPPRNAMVPRLVRPENLVTANSLVLGATYGTVPIGAGLGWALSALPAVTLGGLVPDRNAGLTLAFGFDSLTFLVSAALVASLPVMRSKLAEQNARTGAAGSPRALQELWEGLRFFWVRRSVRRVIVGMTAALVGGGVMIVLGSPFVHDVLHADDTGFFAIITTMGVGAGLGIAFVSLYESRLLRRDLVFALSLLATGTGLSAASVTSTVAGASAWMAVFGFGAGSAYVMGLTHLHEQVSDELRGRVFATMFSLMRVGLFIPMALAPSLQLLLRGVGVGVLTDPKRLVLFLGGAFILMSGIATLWSLRDSFGRPKLGTEAREILAQATEARQGSVHRSPALPDQERR